MLVSKSRVGFAEHLSRTQAAHKGVNHFVATFAINLVTPKAAAKQELLFNKPASMLLAKILHYWKARLVTVTEVFQLIAQRCKFVEKFL
jgi:hypothetical protein